MYNCTWGQNSNISWFALIIAKESNILLLNPYYLETLFGNQLQESYLKSLNKEKEKRKKKPTVTNTEPTKKNKQTKKWVLIKTVNMKGNENLQSDNNVIGHYILPWPF